MYTCSIFKDYPTYPFTSGYDPNNAEIFKLNIPEMGYRVVNEFDSKRIEVFTGIENVQIVDLTGKPVHIENLYGNMKIINLMYLPNGTYIININKQNGESVNEKIIINK